jgi:hypothetical protein
MRDLVLFYISAASDLVAEREILGRAVTEVPVTLGWRVVQSPLGDQPIDQEALVQADVHLLLLGSDIRAPIGQEWMTARRSGRWPILLLKQGILRTLAAQSFVRFVEEQGAWQPFRNGADLRLMVLRLLADHLLRRAGHYALAPVEAAQLKTWRAGLDASAGAVDGTLGGAGEGGVVLSPERYEPSEGILIGAADESDDRGEQDG